MVQEAAIRRKGVIYPTKRNAYGWIFSILGVRSITHLYHLYSFVAQSPISLSPKIHLNRSKSESTISL